MLLAKLFSASLLVLIFFVSLITRNGTGFLYDGEELFSSLSSSLANLTGLRTLFVGTGLSDASLSQLLLLSTLDVKTNFSAFALAPANVPVVKIIIVCNIS